MIVANLATYPPRRDSVIDVVRRVAPQVDQLNLVLNEYDTQIEELTNLLNVRQIIPHEDLKDVGKFFPDVSRACYVVLIDDDLLYPDDYVAQSIDSLSHINNSRAIFGYHGATYVRAKFSLKRSGRRKWWRGLNPKNIGASRSTLHFRSKVDRPTIVDQLGSGTIVMPGELFPPWDFMSGSQKFVDVRLARWCFEQGIECVVLPREEDWLGVTKHDETIYSSFTRLPNPHVADEIRTFAYARQTKKQPFRLF